MNVPQSTESLCCDGHLGGFVCEANNERAAVNTFVWAFWGTDEHISIKLQGWNCYVMGRQTFRES